MEAKITEQDGKIILELIPRNDLEATATNKFFSSYHKGAKLEYIKENNVHKLKFTRYVSKKYLTQNGWREPANGGYFYKWGNIRLYFNTERLELRCDNIFVTYVKSVDDLNAALLQLKNDNKIIYQL